MTAIVTRLQMEDTEGMRLLRSVLSMLNPLTWPSRLIWLAVRHKL